MMNVSPYAVETACEDSSANHKAKNMKIPSKNLDVNISPFKPGQWNEGRFSYYEGRVNVEGTHSGQGFMELTGQNP